MKKVQYAILYIFAAALAAGCGGHENGREVQPADSLFVAEMARAKAYSSEREGNLDSARIVLEQLVRQEGLSLEQSLGEYRPAIRPALKKMMGSGEQVAATGYRLSAKKKEPRR